MRRQLAFRARHKLRFAGWSPTIRPISSRVMRHSHGEQEMAKKLAKAKKLTAKRKLFLDAIRLLEKYFDDDGHVAGDMDEL